MSTMSQSWPMRKEGAIDRLVPIMLPTITSSPSVFACRAIASPSVSPPHLSSLILTMSKRLTSEAVSASESALSSATKGSGRLSPSRRSKEHTSELQSLMRISYADFCLKKKTNLQFTQDHLDSSPSH